MNQTRLDQITFFAAVLLLAGCFGPMTDLKVLGPQSFYDVAEVPAYIVMISSVAAVGMIFGNMRQLTLFAAIGAWLGALMPRFMKWQTSQKEGFFDKAGDIVTDPMNHYAGDVFSHIQSLEWGGYAFFAGLILITVRALIRKTG